MANTWHVDKGLAKLIAQWKELKPGASVGTIGDPDHQSGTSDHNPEEDRSVDAGDFMTGNGVTFADLHAFAIKLAKYRDKRIAYMIIGQQIISPTIQPWVWRPYKGNYHGHLHVSVNDKYENDGTEWRLTDVTTPTADQMESAATRGVLAYDGRGLPSWAGQPDNRAFLNAFTELFRMVASVVTDPATMDNPETHPIVRAVRYANEHPVS